VGNIAIGIILISLFGAIFIFFGLLRLRDKIVTPGVILLFVLGIIWLILFIVTIGATALSFAIDLDEADRVGLEIFKTIGLYITVLCLIGFAVVSIAIRLQKRFGKKK
jgi:hypothetical protein